MKIIILGDTHFSYRVESEAFQNYQKDFYENTLMPYVKKHNIKKVIQTGDLFDNRKNMSALGMIHLKTYLLDPLKKLNVELISYSGNHDLLHTNSSDIYLPEIFISKDEYPNITLINKITTLDGITYIPWVNAGNIDDYTKWSKKSFDRIVLAHFEFSGFNFMKGVEAKNGMSSTDLKDCGIVISGHYHHRSNAGNVYYVGSPLEYTWADCDDPKGFHVLDSETLELEFIQNERVLYKRITFNDDTDLNPDNYGGCFVKINVTNTEHNKKVEAFCDTLYEKSVHKIDILELDVDTPSVDLTSVEVEDTISALMLAVDNMNVPNTGSVKKLLNELHIEVLSNNYE